MKYYVLSQLQHDKTAFDRGDTVELSEDQAAPLIEAGVIQTDEVTEPAPVGRDPQAEIDRAKAEAELPPAAEREESGEPSIDTKETKRGKKAGKDISADL